MKSIGNRFRLIAVRSQYEVAKMLGISRSAVAQAERRALAKLSRRLGAFELVK